jgi:glycosyltransferase involved in cell wall biosynthesis
MVKENEIEEAVLFLGNRSDMPAVYQAFDMFLLPSLFEGLPGVGVEAQAAGLPCFFSDTITDEVGIVTGLFEFLPINEGIDVWCESILKFLKQENIRRDTYKDLCEAGFESDAIARKLEKFYLTI